jgi:hypothetical protein
MMFANLEELRVQKQLYEVVLPPSPHPETMSRTMLLMGPSAQYSRES